MLITIARRVSWTNASKHRADVEQASSKRRAIDEQMSSRCRTISTCIL